MSEILILLCHPDYPSSRANKALVEAAAAIPGVEVAHLDTLYPDNRIDPDTEVKRLLAAKRIILQFPVQWYSTPPLLKQWQDVVLTRMFYVNASEGAQLAGRPVLVAATAGNRTEAYGSSGMNLFPMPDLLRPLEATANRCGLRWQEPFLTFSVKGAPDAILSRAANAYAARLNDLKRVQAV